MRILEFVCRGERYQVNRLGHIRRPERGTHWCRDWLFLGVSKHHWANHIQIPFDPKMPDEGAARFVGGIVWDLDHGSLRTWGGKYCGKLPRITSAFFRELKDNKLEDK